MIVLDLIAALAISVGGFLGARKGFWRMAAGAGAVALGAAVGWTLCDVLTDALFALGVGSPGAYVLGFFLPFALVSIYARYLAGLWLSRMLEERPDRNRVLGAVAGSVWMLFAVGFIGHVVWLRNVPTEKIADAADELPPFVSWLARYPGAVGARIYLKKAIERDRPWSEAIEYALDSKRVHTRTREADEEASAVLRGEAEAQETAVVGAGHAGTPPALNQR